MSSLLDIGEVLSLLLLLTAGVVSSKQSVFYFFYQRPAYPRDCKEALDSCHYKRSSGVYVIRPDGYQNPFEVYCDNTVDAGGWTVILRRHDGSVTFQRNWLDYRIGFGFLSQEVWIGHEKLSFLTNQKMYELRIDITKSDGNSSYALYTFFRTSDGFSNYRLSMLGSYTGTFGVDFLTCPTNMEYGICSCEARCGNSQNCEPCTQGEGCFCPGGFLLRGEDCIQEEECGCFVDGRTLAEGETYTATGCMRRCFCINSQLICDENYRCSINAICERRNNILQCYCNTGFLGNGVLCEADCPINTIFGTCMCQRLCGYPQICIPCSQGEMCYCPTGYFLQGQDCVRQEECNCFVDGNVLSEGETHISSGCSQRCSCTDGQLICDYNYQCGSNAVCVQLDSMFQCRCSPGYVGDGVTCVSICATNQVYGSCGCQITCEDPQGCLLCTQGEMCYCPSDFYLQGQDCVPREDCRCFIDGIIIPEGGSYTSPGCLRRCSCTNGQLFCNDNYRCDSNAVCEQQSNVFQCRCNPGYSGDGVTCVGICTTNEIYGTCSCQFSCENPQRCLPCTPGEMCYCPSGSYLQGQDCVPLEDCRCFTDGNLIPEGESYIFPGCLRMCSCNNGQLFCNDNYRCDSNAVCGQQSNVFQCRCNPGYSGDGITCVGICPTNEIYGTCSCQFSCENPQRCLPCTPGEMCYCPSGSYLQGQECVLLEDCRCFTDGNLIPEAESYTFPGCLRMCSCNNGQLVCNDNYRCDPNGSCVQQNGAFVCSCNAGYSGDGVTCVSSCSLNKVYGTCICQKTCGDPNGCVSCTQGEMCYCPTGSYLRGQDCVGQEDCGCFKDGNIIPNGDTYVNPGCSERCTCTNDQLTCNSNYQCSPNAACRVENGVRQCYCNSGFEGDGESCISNSFTDCFDAYQAGHTTDGVYTILPTGWTGSPFTVFCDMTTAGGGWTVFQRRTDGVTNFYRGWNEYKQGFGNLDAGNDFWLGNEKIYYITNQKGYNLRVDIETSGGLSRYAEYTSFEIGDENVKYRMTIGSYSGDAGNGMSYTNGRSFSTHDQDNDECAHHNYAEGHRGAWWYDDITCYPCYHSYSFCDYFETGPNCNNAGAVSNLNGVYNGGNGRNIFWYYNNYCDLNSAEMKIRPSTL